MQDAAQVTKPAISNKVIVRRPQYDMIKDPFNIKEDDNSGQQYHDDGAHDMPAELLYMVHERHLAMLVGIGSIQETGNETHEIYLCGGREVRMDQLEETGK